MSDYDPWGSDWDAPAEWDAYGPGIIYEGAPTAGTGYTYDSFGNVVPVGDPSASNADPSGLVEIQNKLNDAIKSGNSTNLLNILKGFLSSPAGAATGVAGIASLFGFNQPKSSGYQGGIPVYEARRLKIDQPAYVPYAGINQTTGQYSASTGNPVMGRQFFSPVAYTAPPAPSAAPNAAGGLQRGRPSKAPAPKERYLRGETDGMADKIKATIDGEQPALLSHGEFVVPADVVSHLGNGNSDAGAQVLYKMMDRVRKARTGTKKQGKRINPEKFTPGGIASYASGGSVKAFNTGGNTTTPGTGAASTNPYGSTTSSNLSEWAGPYVTQMLGQGMSLAQMPYQAYTGPLTAGTSPLQQQYFSGLGSLGFPSNFGQSFTDTTPNAAGMTVAQQYMNPYVQQVLNPQMQAMQRQADIQRGTIGASAAKSGMFGGARSGLMESQLNADLMRQQQQAVGQAYNQAYTQGMQQFNTEQQQAGQIAGMLASAGTAQRDIEQQGISALKSQFEEERKYPYAQLQFMQSLLSGLPIGSQTTSQNLTPLQNLGLQGTDLANFYKTLTTILGGSGSGRNN